MHSNYIIHPIIFLIPKIRNCFSIRFAAVGYKMKVLVLHSCNQSHQIHVIPVKTLIFV